MVFCGIGLVSTLWWPATTTSFSRMAGWRCSTSSFLKAVMAHALTQTLCPCTHSQPKVVVEGNALDAAEFLAGSQDYCGKKIRFCLMLIPSTDNRQRVAECSMYTCMYWHRHTRWIPGTYFQNIGIYWDKTPRFFGIKNSAYTFSGTHLKQRSLPSELLAAKVVKSLNLPSRSIPAIEKLRSHELMKS